MSDVEFGIGGVTGDSTRSADRSRGDRSRRDRSRRDRSRQDRSGTDRSSGQARFGRELRRGLAAALPVMLGFVPFALVLGSQAARKGFSPVEVPLMTGLNFGGGSEFAAVELWTSPPHLLLIVAVTLLVNSRHFLMGAAMAPLIRHLPKRKALPLLFFMCDESWAMGLSDAFKSDAHKKAAASHAARLNVGYYIGVSLGLYLTWVSCTTLGALVGPVLGDVTRYGFDMAFPAVFLVMLAGMWKGPRAARPWLVSLVVAATVHLLVPGAWYVPAGAISGVVAAYLWAGDVKAGDVKTGEVKADNAKAGRTEEGDA